MCGRYTLRTSPAELQEFFQLNRMPLWEPRTNIFPTQPVLGIILDGSERAARLYRWGLIPVWSKDIKIGARMINARGETIAEKPSFRSAFKRRRCLIPADGFYEWEAIPGQKKKRPWYIGVAGKPIVAFAGIWEHWTGADGAEIESCAIVTTDANSSVARIHDRMPVILPEETYNRWLDPNSPSAELQPLLIPYDQGEMILSTEIADQRLSPAPPGSLF